MVKDYTTAHKAEKKTNKEDEENTSLIGLTREAIHFILFNIAFGFTFYEKLIRNH